jgi:AcrR family transcriptional regulator
MEPPGEADSPRQRILDGALRLLEEGGPEALQARKLAATLGISTMGVYTHFGSIPGLLEAVAREGFIRFAAAVAAVEETDDPLADFIAKGFVYRRWATANPRLYCCMFGLGVSTAPRFDQDITVAGTLTTLPEGQAAFDVMVRALGRVKLAGLIEDVDTVAAAAQILSATHGYVLLEIAGYLGSDGNGFAWVYAPMGLSIMVGFGADRVTVEKAAVTALGRFGISEAESRPG